MKTKFILLWLEAPLQSWGADSKFGRRDTLQFPTKSGVLGLLCCALGATGEQQELLSKMAPLKQTVISYARTKEKEKQDKGKVRVKIDREPLLRDFHMVGSGYNAKDSWETFHIPMTWDVEKIKAGKANNADGTRGGTKMTYRYYLQDARFAVSMEAPEELSNDFSYALQNPVYDLYLGRKNCAPTDFIFRGVYDTEEEALTEAGKIAESPDKALAEDFRVIDGESEGEHMTLNDVPLLFGEAKKYRDRLVSVKLT
jgi:CRISPR system Cascade subunit CasD